MDELEVRGSDTLWFVGDKAMTSRYLCHDGVVRSWLKDRLCNTETVYYKTELLAIQAKHEYEGKGKQMKKADLKEGMTVRLQGYSKPAKVIFGLAGANGGASLVYNDGVHCHLTSYDNDLNYCGDWKEYTIEKVYAQPKGSLDLMNIDTTTELLHDTITPTEMTIADIEDALSVRNLKIIK